MTFPQRQGEAEGIAEIGADLLRQKLGARVLPRRLSPETVSLDSLRQARKVLPVDPLRSLVSYWPDIETLLTEIAGDIASQPGSVGFLAPELPLGLQARAIGSADPVTLRVIVGYDILNDRFLLEVSVLYFYTA